MHMNTLMAAKAASFALLAGVVSATEWEAWSTTTSSDPAYTTITPCPGAPSKMSALWPITVTEQYQTVKTCTTSEKCRGKFCKTAYSCSPYAWVSTEFPNCNGDTVTVTKTEQDVTLSTWATTITSWADPSGDFPPWVTPSPTPVYSTIAKQFVCPYEKIGSFPVPDWEGSGICGEDCDPKEDGSTWQELDVIECHSGPAGPTCWKFEEIWVSRTHAATTVPATGTCNHHFSAPSAGTWTFSVPFTAPAPPAVTFGPHPFEWDPMPWFWTFTKTCDGPMDWDVTTTVTKTVTFTPPAWTKPATTSSDWPVPTGPSGHPSFPGFPAPTGETKYIQIFEKGAKYHSGSKYIGWSGDDGMVVTDKGSAAGFVFGDGKLTCEGEYIGAETPFQPFEKYEKAPAYYQGWSLDGAEKVSWSGAYFCTKGDSLFVGMGSAPAGCVEVDLSCGDAPTSTGSDWYPSTTSSYVPDKSSEPESSSWEDWKKPYAL